MSGTQLEVYIGQVLTPDRRDQLLKSLPSYIKPEVFERNLINALMANPKLLNYDARLIYREVSKAAAIGVLLDPILQEAYLVPQKDSVQLRIGYRGLMKLARISLNGAIIYAHEVYEHDYFKCSLGDSKRLVHEPEFFVDRGDVLGYYSVIKFNDGTFDFECMSVAEVNKIRDRSDGWNAFKKGLIRSTPWETDEIEMAKKTVIRRLMKRQPQSPELAQAFAVEDAADFPQLEKKPLGRPIARPVKDEGPFDKIPPPDDWPKPPMKMPVDDAPPPLPEDGEAVDNDGFSA